MIIYYLIRNNVSFIAKFRPIIQNTVEVMKYSIKSRLINEEILDEHEYSHSHFTWGEGSWDTYHKSTRYLATMEHMLYVSDVELYDKLGGSRENIELKSECNQTSECKPTFAPMTFKCIASIEDMKILGANKENNGDYIYVNQDVIGDKETYTYERLIRQQNEEGLFWVRCVVVKHYYTVDKEIYSTR